MVVVAVSVEDVLRRHAATSRCRFVASPAASVVSRPAPLRVQSGGSDTGNGFGPGCGLQECCQIGFIPNPTRTKRQFSHGPGLESSRGVPLGFGPIQRNRTRPKGSPKVQNRAKASVERHRRGLATVSPELSNIVGCLASLLAGPVGCSYSFLQRKKIKRSLKEGGTGVRATLRVSLKITS
jgi:hypothetical protein